MTYDSISDPTNTFNKTGLSLEDRALLRYVEDAKAATGHDFVVTSTTDHPLNTASGNLSRHRQPGTSGEGLAIDGRMRTRGTAKGLHRPWFDAFVPVEHYLQELIYAFAPYNIKAGKRVAPYAVSSHADHCHVAVARGVMLRYPTATPQPKPTEAQLMAQVPNASGYCFLPNADLVICSTDGALYFFDADGVADDREWVDAYNVHPDWWGGASPTTHRKCIGVAVAPDADFVTQVFDDGSTYQVRAKK